MKKVALITGASKGIGFAIAQAVAPHVEHMIIVARNKKQLEKAASKLASKTVTILDADLEKADEIKQIVGFVTKEFGRLDLLVNNAGVYIGKSFEKHDVNELLSMVNLNLQSYFLLTHGLIPLLKKGKESQIINTSSCAAHTNIEGEAVYSATKAAVSTFSDVLRKELNREGIRITTIQPWGVDTYETAMPDVLLAPSDIGNIVEYIVLAPATVQIDLVELSHIKQWRGEKPPWIQ